MRCTMDFTGCNKLEIQDCMWLRGLRERVIMASHSRKTQLNGRLRTAFENSLFLYRGEDVYSVMKTFKDEMKVIRFNQWK